MCSPLPEPTGNSGAGSPPSPWSSGAASSTPKLWHGNSSSCFLERNADARLASKLKLHEFGVWLQAHGNQAPGNMDCARRSRLSTPSPHPRRDRWSRSTPLLRELAIGQPTIAALLEQVGDDLLVVSPCRSSTVNLQIDSRQVGFTRRIPGGYESHSACTLKGTRRRSGPRALHQRPHECRYEFLGRHRLHA